MWRQKRMRRDDETRNWFYPGSREVCKHWPIRRDRDERPGVGTWSSWLGGKRALQLLERQHGSLGSRGKDWDPWAPQGSTLYQSIQNPWSILIRTMSIWVCSGWKSALQDKVGRRATDAWAQGEVVANAGYRKAQTWGLFLRNELEKKASFCFLEG